VTQHLKSHPPRKYTFHEWAWFLRLMGEDEGDAGRHHKAHTTANNTNYRGTAATGPDSHDQRQKQTLPYKLAKSGAKLVPWVGGRDKKKTTTAAAEGEKEKDDGDGDGVATEKRDTQSQQQHEGTATPTEHDSLPSASNPTKPTNGDQQRQDNNIDNNNNNKLWSWVGARSPLMGSLEEAEWVLEKLTEKLTRELRAVRSSRDKNKTDHSGRGNNVDGYGSLRRRKTMGGSPGGEEEHQEPARQGQQGQRQEHEAQKEREET
jgi:potassium channel subfamily K